MVEKVNNINRILINCLVLITLLFTSIASAQTEEDELDWLYVNRNTVELGLTERTTLLLGATFTFEDNMGEYFNNSAKVGVKYKATDWLDVGFGHSYLYRRKYAGVWKKEDKLYGMIAPHVELGGWKVNNRSLLEYGDRKGRDPLFKLRSKFNVVSPFKLTSLKLNPYASKELFVLERRGLYKRRDEFGVQLPFFSDDVYLRAFYMDEHTYIIGEDIHHFGTTLNFKF